MENSLEQLLKIIIHTFDAMEEEMKGKSELMELTSRQIFCIEQIKSIQNPNLSELAEIMNIAKPSMTVMINRLEKNRLVQKVQSDSDRRTAHLHLTDKGEKAARLHEELHTRISEILVSDLTESEQEILIVLLNKAVRSLNQ
ncbi:MAG: mprA [Bacteroidetes bacterium]|nr:mprA [Bacteroidota bacterium]